MNFLKLLALSSFLMATSIGATAQSPPPDPTARKEPPPTPQPPTPKVEPKRTKKGPAKARVAAKSENAVADPALIPPADLGVRRVAPSSPGRMPAGKERKRYQILRPDQDSPGKKALRSSTKRGLVEETKAAVGEESNVVKLLKETHAKDDIRIVQEV